MAGRERLAPEDAEFLRFFGPIAGGLSVLALAVLFFATPLDEDEQGLYIALGFIHALAIAPIGGFIKQLRVGVVLLFFGALSFGFWVFPLFFVAGYFTAPAAGIIWATFAGVATQRSLLAAALFTMALSMWFVPPLAFSVTRGFLAPGVTDVIFMFASCAVWHFGATWATYWALSFQPPRDPRVCENCEYALEGLTTNTCPECGEPISPPASPPSAQRSAP